MFLQFVDRHTDGHTLVVVKIAGVEWQFLSKYFVYFHALELKIFLILHWLTQQLLWKNDKSFSFSLKLFLFSVVGRVADGKLSAPKRDGFHSIWFRLHQTPTRSCHTGNVFHLLFFIFIYFQGNITSDIKIPIFQASTKNSISDSEKREKKMLEKKLSEMEEELKVLYYFPNSTFLRKT